MNEEPTTAQGMIGCVPVQPKLTLRQLARVDTQGVIASQGIVALSPAWLRRSARKTATKTLQAWYRGYEQQNTATLATQEESLTLPSRIGARKRFSLSTYAPAIPWHNASRDQSGVLNPFVVAGYSPFEGPVIGISALTGNVWRYDAWQPYVQKVSTSVNGWIIGLMGSGKSMLLKIFATRETPQPWNRSIIIEGDPKGEWAAVANSVGGQVISIGSGSYLNPLDPGQQPQTRSNTDWHSDVFGLQSDALRAIAATLRDNGKGEIDDQEGAVIDAALAHFFTINTIPTITTLVDLLSAEWPHTTPIKGLSQEQARSAANRLILLYNPLITGALSGAFERDSTVSIDPASPMVVFNTGSATEENQQKKALYMAAMSATVERLCAQRDGRFRIVIAEEGHELLANPVLVRAWDRRIRLSGELGVSNWFLMHELGDLSSFGAEGSEQRNTINGILTKSTAQIIYAQSAASLTEMERLLPDLTAREINTIQALPEFCALWRIGSTVRDIIHPLLSPIAYNIFQTDKNRQG